MSIADSFFLQIYDDGAGEYLFESPIDCNLGAGNCGTQLGNDGNSFGPFILPSPKAVTAPGLLTVSMSNINAPANEGNDVANDVVVAVALVFAVPKRCRGKFKGMNGMSASRETRGIIT